MFMFVRVEILLPCLLFSMCVCGMWIIGELATENGQPLVVKSMVARHADGRLGGLGSEHVLEGIRGPSATEFILSEKQNCQGKYIYPSHSV